MTMIGPPPPLGNPLPPVVDTAGAAQGAMHLPLQEQHMDFLGDFLPQQLIPFQNQTRTPLSSGGGVSNHLSTFAKNERGGEGGQCLVVNDHHDGSQQNHPPPTQQGQQHDLFASLQAQHLVLQQAVAAQPGMLTMMTHQQGLLNNFQSTGFFVPQLTSPATGSNFMNIIPTFISSPPPTNNATINPDAFASSTGNKNTSMNDEWTTPILGAADKGLYNHDFEPTAFPEEEADGPTATGADTLISGRKPVLLFMGCDEECLSEYQCLVRQQIEMFEAGSSDLQSSAKGRNKPIALGQVGIRCRHCSMIPPKQRKKGAMYFPTKLNGLYQAAQSLASGHLCTHCDHIPTVIREELLILKEKKSSAGGGKDYWGDGVRIIGVYENDDGLRFTKEKK